MIRLLFWVLLGGLIYFALRKKLRDVTGTTNNAERPGNLPSVNKNGAENMLVCAHCGVYFPASEAVIVYDKDHQQQVFCSQEHQHLHAGQ